MLSDLESRGTGRLRKGLSRSESGRITPSSITYPRIASLRVEKTLFESL